MDGERGEKRDIETVDEQEEKHWEEMDDTQRRCSEQGGRLIHGQVQEGQVQQTCMWFNQGSNSGSNL